jgi:hypothetical protein
LPAPISNYHVDADVLLLGNHDAWIFRDDDYFTGRQLLLDFLGISQGHPKDHHAEK